ncbi:MAG: hypothetical protein HC876_22285 [Chloroflexaceae bacterium]|nr:hypothetical protein [Chloroflexaceae bacterium]NJO08024.1 hypothetical protein [Chloroflexaceae bacterium]
MDISSHISVRYANIFIYIDRKNTFLLSPGGIFGMLMESFLKRQRHHLVFAGMA